MTAAASYFDKTMGLLRDVRDQEFAAILKAADVCTSSIAQGGLVFLFGNGHSRMMCEEMTPRQGCFPGFVALVEQALSNHADIVGSNGLRGPHDAFMIISTSGIRPVVVEMATGVKRRGMPVIAIVSRQHSEIAAAGHSSGKKLIDLADIVIDNHCPPGDCVVEIEGLEWRTGPASTVTGGMIINMLRCEVAERLIARGLKPVLLPSHQFVGNADAAEQLERFYEVYRKSLRHLYE